MGQKVLVVDDEKAIIEYRSEKGAFTKAEDIMQIPGIKEGIYRKIQDQIIV